VNDQQLLEFVDGLKAAWSTKEALRTAFVSREQFIEVNIQAIHAEEVSTGKPFGEIYGSFPLVEAP
jgi:hypothetical protein